MSVSTSMMSTDEKLTLLRLNSFLGTADSDFLRPIAQESREQSFRANDFIFSREDKAGDFYILAQGRVGHPEVLSENDEYGVTTGARLAGQLFGFAAVVQGLPRRVISANCEQDTVVLAIDGVWF
ncbi:MAG: cyclic nucleotide-binding domain-containing protein, partial [Lacisediminimonas sp.]|nr:cyclic nucleotide-binding domain-containing protein [Lacisediminimonas sp.]